MRRRGAGSVCLVAALVLIGGACGGDGDDGAERPRTTTTAGATTTASAAELAPLAVTAVQFVDLFNEQLPRVAAESSLDLQLDPVADGVYGGLISLGTQVFVFADSPTDRVGAVSVLIDTEITGGRLAPRLIGAAGSFLADDPAATLDAFNDEVVPTLGEISEAREEFDLDALDLIITVTPPVVAFTFLAPGGEVPTFPTG